MYTLKGLAFLAVCLASSMAGPVDNRVAVQAVSEGTNAFSNAFFSEIALANRGKNLITSPLSAAVVLSMAAYGARGTTEEEMKKVLHLPEETLATPGFSQLLRDINNVKDVELSLANTAFVNKHFSVKPTYQQLTQDAFLSTSQSLDFSQSAVAASTINHWVEEHTNNRIKDLIKPDSVDGGTAMVLVNAVYFKGNWKNKFDPKLTKDRPFHVSKDEVKDVPTMFRSGLYNYAVVPECKASAIEIPYKGGEISMLIILPDEVDGLPAIEKKFATHNIADVLKRLHMTDVNLYLPKFKIESSINLNDHLKNLGIVKAFDQSEANFSGISDVGLYISDAVQKAYIEVNEEGSEAAGASDVNIGIRSGRPGTKPRKPVFRADRPFLSIIANKKDLHVVEVFTAHVFNPSTQ